jgi:hypothetical protein
LALIVATIEEIIEEDLSALIDGEDARIIRWGGAGGDLCLSGDFYFNTPLDV